MDENGQAIQRNIERAFPEVGAGGFSRVDGTIAFYTRINALIRPNMRVLDLGAGRGGQIHDAATPFLRDLLTLKGKVATIVGADVDDAVLENPFLDEAKQIEIGAPLPFEDQSFDLIYADWVLEHIADPEAFAAEINRILKPNGWFCARTPNRWGITGIAANAVPSSLHAGIVRRLQPGRKEFDVFPTCYKLNSGRRIERFFPSARFENLTYLHNAEPPYVQRSRLAISLVRAFFRFAPEALSTNLFVFLRKR